MQNTTTDLLPIYQETLYTHAINNEGFVKMGNNTNGIAILIIPKDNEADKIALLQKMVLACKLDFEACAIIEIPDDKNALDCIKINNYTTILSFGIFINNGIIQLPTVAYKPFPIGNCTIICSHSLQDLSTSAPFKQALWNCLKVYFEL
jgi:hypothetical protein